jgi:hypothetical protein
MIKVEEKRRRIEASFLDDLFKDLSKSMFQGLVDRLEEGARGVLGWSLKQLALTLISIGIIVTAAVLILVAGVEGLKQASLPTWLAYLITGVVGLGSGGLLLLLKR